MTAIELLNEPFGYSLDLNQLRSFYQSGYNTIHQSSNNVAVCIQDAFQDIQSYWNGFMGYESGFNNVILDTHIYQIFTTAQVAMNFSSHISSACSQGPKVAGTDKWTIVGEWTGALTDCAKWLNGYGKGARYNGTFTGYGGSSYVGSCAGKDVGTVAGLSPTDKTNIAKFIEAQLDAYEKHSGWIF